MNGVTAHKCSRCQQTAGDYKALLTTIKTARPCRPTLDDSISPKKLTAIRKETTVELATKSTKGIGAKRRVS